MGRGPSCTTCGCSGIPNHSSRDIFHHSLYVKNVTFLTRQRSFMTFQTLRLKIHPKMKKKLWIWTSWFFRLSSVWLWDWIPVQSQRGLVIQHWRTLVLFLAHLGAFQFVNYNSNYVGFVVAILWLLSIFGLKFELLSFRANLHKSAMIWLRLKRSNKNIVYNYPCLSSFLCRGSETVND